MLNRKILFTFAASVAAVGIALAPVAASAKQHEQPSQRQQASQQPQAWQARARQQAPPQASTSTRIITTSTTSTTTGTTRSTTTTPTPSTSCRRLIPTRSRATYSKPTYTYSKPADNCTCLTKEYTEDGSVVFKDVCTKESAINSSSKKTAEADD